MPVETTTISRTALIILGKTGTPASLAAIIKGEVPALDPLEPPLLSRFEFVKGIIIPIKNTVK